MRVFFLFLILVVLSAVTFYMYGPKELTEKYSVYFDGAITYYNQMTGKETKPSEWLTKDESFFAYTDLNGKEYVVNSLEEVPANFRDGAVMINPHDVGHLDMMTKEQEAKLINAAQADPVPEMFKKEDHSIIIYSYEGAKLFPPLTAHFKKFYLQYEVRDVVDYPEYAMELKVKLGLDVSKKYTNLNLPIVDINGEMIEPIVSTFTDEANIERKKVELDLVRINKKFGIRSADLT